jgi:hypothetical protein
MFQQMTTPWRTAKRGRQTISDAHVYESFVLSD